jgi:putative transposase
MNPVRARLAARAQEWPWSSVRAHLAGRDDGLVAVKPLLDRVQGFAALLEDAQPHDDDAHFAAIRDAEGSGRPLGTPDFVADVERRLGRPLAHKSAGRKPAGDKDDQPKLL